MSRFGELLRYYRSQCWDAENKKSLTQSRLGELLGRALGDMGYSGAAVSEWERGKSRISYDQRRVLVNLLKALHEQGGLRTLREADALLSAGDYRSLDRDEQRAIKPDWAERGALEDRPARPGGPWRMIALFLSEWVLRLAEALEQLKSRGSKGSSDWTAGLLEVMGRPSHQWSSAQALRAIVWTAVWLLGWGLTFPVLQWPFVNREQAELAAAAYSAGALIVPIFIGGLTRTQEDEFWKRQRSVKTWALRLFTHQGALIGFTVGYMMVFIGALAGHYLALGRAPRWLEGIIAAWPIILGYAAARQVPFNLWRAYGGLRFAALDLIPSLAFVLFGPFWAAFFYAYHPWLLYAPAGLALILCALGIAAGSAAWQARAAQTPKRVSPHGGD